MKGATEDEMVGWHHRLNGHEFEQTSGDRTGRGRTKTGRGRTRTGKPGVLQSMESSTVERDLMTEQHRSYGHPFTKSLSCVE